MQFYKDFQVTKELPLHELQARLTELVHLSTGACVIHIHADDPENLFCLSFQTLPDSSNGVAHILEHTVLCGSKKFPVKDPFFSMTRRSLNTYMNALTGQDFTCYPASSQVEKDFYNLLDVYLDAVFHPNLKHLSFLQEGHRLEFNKESTLQFQGVVYNEMKGAMNAPESRLWEALAKKLLPDLPYAYNSGGNPKEIPSLSYEELVAFHKNFYHPSRCLFFFYGNLPLTQHLDFIETRALQGVQKQAPLPPLPLQKRYLEPLSISAPYSIATNEPPQKKTEIAFAWLTAPLSDQQKVLALCLLDLLLLETDASPLKIALLKSGLCNEVDASMDLEMSEVPWIIVCKGADPENTAALKKVLLNTVRKLTEEPFDPELIEASLHQLEFDRTEISGEGVPFGLILFFRAALIHQHGSDPENALLIHTLFAQLRERLKDPRYLPELLKEVILDNPHFVTLTLYPDPELDAKEAEEERERLAAIQAKLTKNQVAIIHKQSKQLLELQEANEHQSLDTLPKLSVSDIPTDARDFSLSHHKEKGLEVFHHACFTNQILYADLFFDLPELSEHDLSLASLFARLMSEVGCGGRNYEETLAYQQAYTGEIEASLSLHVTQEDPNRCRPGLSIRGKALQRNASHLFQLFSDMASSLQIRDLPRIQELLSQHATNLQSQFTKSALTYATQTALCGHSLPSHIHNQWSGIPYYEAVLKWEKNCTEKLLDSLEHLQHLFLKSPPRLILSCDAAQYASLAKHHFYNLADLPHSSITPWRGDYPLPNATSQVRLIGSPVAFTAYGLHTISYCNPDAPLLTLAAELLENCILHKEIREKGGAYGGGASYSPTSGNFHLYAYRDPQLARTESTFHKAILAISEGTFDDSDLMEAKFGAIQALDAPIPPGNRAKVAFAWHRAHRTYAQRQEFRKRILAAGKGEVAAAVRRYLAPQEGVLVSFLGKELYEKERNKLINRTLLEADRLPQSL